MNLDLFSKVLDPGRPKSFLAPVLILISSMTGPVMFFIRMMASFNSVLVETDSAS